MSRLDEIHDRLVRCESCPRLVEWRRSVASERRAAFRDQEYWGRPVPGFGDPDASILVMGLAPAAHGANRTGRMFTGDRSGDWLFASLRRTGLANQSTSLHVDDGLTLRGAFITSAVHCAPPANRPTADEKAACMDWTVQEVRALPVIRVVVALGAIGFRASLDIGEEVGWGGIRPRPRFGHGVEATFPKGPGLLGCYHPSQQNTFTGRLTEAMLDDVFSRAVEMSGIGR